MRDIKIDVRKISLILEGLASIIRIIVSLDLNGSRLLYNFRISRALITLSLPFSIGTIALFVISSTYSINRQIKKKRSKPFTEIKWLKYVFAGILIFLFLIEFITLILVMTIYDIYEKIVTFTYTIYIVLFLLSAILYLVILYIMIRMIRIRIEKALEGLTEDKKKKAENFLKRFIYRFIYGFCCIILLSISFLMNLSYPSIKDPYTRVIFMNYNPLFSFYALCMLSMGHVFFYYQSIDMTNNSSKSSPTSKSSKSTSHLMNINVNIANTSNVIDE